MTGRLDSVARSNSTPFSCRRRGPSGPRSRRPLPHPAVDHPLSSPGATVMKRFAVHPAALFVAGAAACPDKIEKPTEPAAKPKAAAAAAAAAAPVTSRSGSTVCLSYVTKKASALARLKHARELMAG